MNPLWAQGSACKEFFCHLSIQRSIDGRHAGFRSWQLLDRMVDTLQQVQCCDLHLLLAVCGTPPRSMASCEHTSRLVTDQQNSFWLLQSLPKCLLLATRLHEVTNGIWTHR